MSCYESEPESELVVERHVELPADPETVWDELPALLGDEVELTAESGAALHARDVDGERVGIVREAVPGERLSFWWTAAGDDDLPPSQVDVELERTASGTILHIRETRLDGAHLERSTFLALARA